MPSLTTVNNTSNTDMDTKTKSGTRQRSMAMKPSSMANGSLFIIPQLNSTISTNSQRPSGRAKKNKITSLALRKPKVAAVKTRKWYESKINRSESLRTPAKAVKVKNRNNCQGPLHGRNNRHDQHRIDTNSFASVTEEDMNADRYANIEQSPVETRKAAISSFHKGHSTLSPIANPLHRFPPRMMQPRRRNAPQVRIRPSNIIYRKEQVKRDIATTLVARMKANEPDTVKANEPGNVNYEGMPSKKSNKSQYARHYNGDFNNNLKSFQARPKRILMQNSDETEHMSNISSIRKRSHGALMGRDANASSPTLTKASNTSHAQIYLFGPSATYDDELTFNTTGSGMTVGRECTELRGLNDAICIGLESGVSYATENNIDDGKEQFRVMAKNAKQMEGQMVEEIHALGETIENGCEGTSDAANSLMMQMAKRQGNLFDAGKETCGAMDEIGYVCSDDQTEATTEKKGTLKKLHDAIKKRKGKWFDTTANNALRTEGETVDGETIGKDCEGIAEFSYEVVDSVLSKIANQNFLCCARYEEVDGTTDVIVTERLLDERHYENEDTSERYDKYGRKLMVKKGLRRTKGETL